MRRGVVRLVTACLVAVLLTAGGAPASAAPTTTAAQLLGELTVAPEVRAGYDRALFEHWVDEDRNGCDTRREVLIAESTVPVTRGSGCAIVAGRWVSPYDGAVWTDPAQVQIDHLVALAEAWDSGAHAWPAATRRAFANDLGLDDSLVAVTGSVNQAKSDHDPSTWWPPLTSYRCDYATAWVRVKHRWSLTVDTAEKAALSSVLTGECGSRTVAVPPRGSTASTPAPTPVTSFVDVPSGHTWYTQITWLARQGVTTGYADRTFRPGQPVLREQMAAFLYRLAGRPAYDAPTRPRFTDVPRSHTFYREISWLASRGISAGYPDGTFRPGQPVLREQMAAFLRRLEGTPAVQAPSSRPFTDVGAGHTFYLDIVWLARRGVSTGWDSGYGCREYRPGLAVQRGDMAAFMYRLRVTPAAAHTDGSGCRPPPPPPPPPAPNGPVAPIAGTWNCPSYAPIKGNRSSMIYHVPGGQYYNATNPEECFRSASDAVAAGYRASKR